jgi:hypothetical protein
LLQVAVRDRVRRAVARDPALPLERFDQRRFLAAHVRPRPHEHRDVEVEAAVPQQVAPQQVRATARQQRRLDGGLQVQVLGAQVDEALLRPDHVGADRHPVEHQVELRAQQGAVLERPRLALVGIAHHEARGPRGGLGGGPLVAGREAGTAATAQARALEFGQHPIGAASERGAKGITRCDRGGEQSVAPLDHVAEREQLGGPVRQRGARLDEPCDLVDARLGEPGDRASVHQERRPLLAQPGTRGESDAHPTVRPHLVRRDSQRLAEPRPELRVTAELVDDAVGEEDAVLALRCGRKERVEAGHPFHASAWQAQVAGELGDHRW